MPLAVGAGSVAPPPVVASPVAPPVVVRTPPAADIPSATWTDPYGTVWPLTDLKAGWFTTAGVKGLGAVGATLTTDADERGGVSVRHVYTPPRLITWPLYVEGRNHGEFLDRWRALARAFTATKRRGPGTLKIGRPDGTARQIFAYLQDGFEGDPDLGIRQDLAALTLFCPRPWWRDPHVTPITREHAGAGASYLSPYPQVSSSQTLGAFVAVNPGSVEVWPQWRIVGPAATVTATNSTRGHVWTLDVVAFRGSALVAGETVTITTDPPAVVGPDGLSWYGALDTAGGSVLWGLDDGVSELSFTATGSGAGTVVEASFYGLHETA